MLTMPPTPEKLPGAVCLMKQSPEEAHSDDESTVCSSDGAISRKAISFAVPLSEYLPSLLPATEPETELSRQVKVKSYQRLQAPYWLATMLAQEDANVALRMFLLDNSGSTSTYDGHVVEEDSDGNLLSTSSTRWEEICAVAVDQARWSAFAGVRSEFHLLNPPCPLGTALGTCRYLQEGRDFVVIDSKSGNAEAQVEALCQFLRINGPRGAKTPLSTALQQLQEWRLHPTGLNGRRIMLSIITDGQVSDQVATFSDSSGHARYAHKQTKAEVAKQKQDVARQKKQQEDQSKSQYVQQLRAFASTWNAFVVIRLTTDEKSTVDYFNAIDKELELPVDVVDDLPGEAQEVYSAGNGWFAYTPMIHRMRERGCTLERLFELLNERTLGLSEIVKFMELFFREPDEKPFPRHPAKLLTLAGEINARSAPVYDARLDKVVSPLNIKQLKKALRLTPFERMKSMGKRITRTITGSSRPARD